MNVEAAKIFCDLVQTTSFTLTAQKHGMTQSAVSQQLMALEGELKTVLILRGRNNFQLTPEGKICHQCCLEITRLTAEMVKRLEQATNTTRDTINLAACSSIGLHHLRPVLERFRRDFPKIEINVRYEHIDRVYELVLDDTVNLGLVAYPRRLPELTIDRFRLERLMLICHPQHPLTTRRAVTVRELKDQKFVAWTEIRSSCIFTGLPQNLRQKLEPMHEFNEVEMVKRAVEMDEGIAILPEAFVREEVACGRLAAVPVEDGGYTEPLAVIYRENRGLSPAMEQFIQALKQPESVAC